jgi:signal peptidase I
VRAGSGSPEPAGSASPASTVPERALASVQASALRRRRSRWPLGLAAAIVVVLLVRIFVLQVFWVPTASMVPTLVPGDRVLVNKAAYWLHGPRRGDVVVFSGADHEDFVKRVIALPGQTWEIRGGIVYVDGRALDEPYVGTRDDRSFGPGTVPAGRLFVLGDDRPRSEDSRFSRIGYVPIGDVVGRVVARAWPAGRFGWL